MITSRNSPGYFRVVGDTGVEQEIDSNGAALVVVTGSNTTQQTATIANAASLSGVIDLGKLTLLGIHMPALWTAANMTFQVSEDGITYDNLYDRFGTEVNYKSSSAMFMPCPPSDWIGIRFIKLRSGTASVPVAQGAARAIVLVTRAV